MTGASSNNNKTTPFKPRDADSPFAPVKQPNEMYFSILPPTPISMRSDSISPSPNSLSASTISDLVSQSTTTSPTRAASPISSVPSDLSRAASSTPAPATIPTQSNDSFITIRAKAYHLYSEELEARLQTQKTFYLFRFRSQEEITATKNRRTQRIEQLKELNNTLINLSKTDAHKNVALQIAELVLFLTTSADRKSFAITKDNKSFIAQCNKIFPPDIFKNMNAFFRSTRNKARLAVCQKTFDLLQQAPDIDTSRKNELCEHLIKEISVLEKSLKGFWHRSSKKKAVTLNKEIEAYKIRNDVADAFTKLLEGMCNEIIVVKNPHFDSPWSQIATLKDFLSSSKDVPVFLFERALLQLVNYLNENPLPENNASGSVKLTREKVINQLKKTYSEDQRLIPLSLSPSRTNSSFMLDSLATHSPQTVRSNSALPSPVISRTNSLSTECASSTSERVAQETQRSQVVPSSASDKSPVARKLAFLAVPRSLVVDRFQDTSGLPTAVHAIHDESAAIATTATSSDEELIREEVAKKIEEINKIREDNGSGRLTRAQVLKIYDDVLEKRSRPEWISKNENSQVQQATSPFSLDEEFNQQNDPSSHSNHILRSLGK